MTQLELFRAAVEHKRGDSFLYYANFTPDLERRIRERFGVEQEEDMGDFFGMFSPQMVPEIVPYETEPDFSRYYDDIDIPADAYLDRFGVLHVPGDFYHFRRRISPLRHAKSLEDIESFPIPMFKEGFESGMSQLAKKANREGRVTVTCIGHMYETAWQIRGYEQFLEDMLLRPAWCESILDRLMQRNRQLACAGAKAGVDFLKTGDDVANQNALMFSPDTWRKLIKSRWNAVYEAAKSIKPDIQIWYHSDGNIMDIIQELVDIGVTILNPVQPECLDPVKVKARWGDRIILDGTIGTQSTMPWDKPEQVRSVVRKRIKTLGYDGALILSPTHILEPEVPIENIEAFLDSVG